MARVVETRKSRLLLGGLVLAHLVAISRQVQVDPTGTSLLERSAFTVLSPLQAGVSATVHGLGGLWSSYVGLRGTHAENERLRVRLREVEVALQQRQAEAEEAARLRTVLELRGSLPYDTLVAEVITRDATPWFRTLTVDKGRRHGVALDAPVISPTGVVGRVIRLGPQAATVQLLLDQQAGVGVRIERSRITGVVSGQIGFGNEGGHDLVLKWVPALADVVVGDAVVTSGLDRIYPRGLMVGRVRTIQSGHGLFKEIRLQPSARFDELEEVLVLRTPLPDDTTVESVRPDAPPKAGGRR
jgi:rod shape-determining protein MreC